MTAKQAVATCRADSDVLKQIAAVLATLDQQCVKVNGTLEVYDVAGCAVTVEIQAIANNDGIYHVIKVL